MDNAKRDVDAAAPQDVGNLKTAATTALQELPHDDTEAKKEIATTALQTLPLEDSGARKEIATLAAQALPASEQAELARRLQGPSRQVSDRIWQWIVASFAIVFVLGTGALIVGVFYNPTQLQILVTVFTTVAGILAGFISGRASSAESGARNNP